MRFPEKKGSEPESKPLGSSQSWNRDVQSQVPKTLVSKIFIPIVIVLLVFGIMFFYLLLGKANPWNKYFYEIEIPPGYTAYEIGKVLEKQGIILSRLPFNLTLLILGGEGEIKTGKYKLSPSMSLWKIIRKLTKGEAEIAEFRLTFPEGFSVYRMARILEKFKIAAYRDFENYTAKEGYLFPDTYNIAKDISAEALVEKMQSRFNEVVLPFWEKAKKDTKYSLRQIITLASIIEKEAAKAEERPIIASVFYNRLKKRMPLEACPTVKYALERPTKKVYLDQTKVDSPYNTYKYIGLPPGPICNPGLLSIQAAIYPAKTDYYFFVAKKDQFHIFSRTWDEHQKARQEAVK